MRQIMFNGFTRCGWGLNFHVGLTGNKLLTSISTIIPALNQFAKAFNDCVTKSGTSSAFILPT